MYDIDYESIPSPQWIRTNAIAFYFTYLQTIFDDDLLKDGSVEPKDRKRVWFADTSVVQCMCTFGDASLGPQDRLVTSDVLLLPINDYAAGDRINAGSHWSLLRVALKRNADKTAIQSVEFLHLDSCGIANRRHALDVVAILVNFYQQQHPDVSIQGAELTKAYDNFPQQQNQHDCGPYMCCAAREYFLYYSALNAGDMKALMGLGGGGGANALSATEMVDPLSFDRMTPQYCNDFRKVLMDLLVTTPTS